MSRSNSPVAEPSGRRDEWPLPALRPILITGFGPFPGMPVNASGPVSARVAALLSAKSAAHKMTGHEAVPVHPLGVHHAILPTRWGVAEAQVARLCADHAILAHFAFGVSARASGIVIEQQASQWDCVAPDDTGGLSPRCGGGQAIPSGPDIHSAWNVDALIAEARARLSSGDGQREVQPEGQGVGIRLSKSTDAGAYLCNAVFRTGMAAIERAHGTRRALFLHIPAWTEETAPDQPRDRNVGDQPADAGSNGQMPLPGAWEAIAQAGAAIVATALYL